MRAACVSPPRVAAPPACEQARRIPVLFIAGAPRSGSTLLDRLLGMQDGFVSTGELQFIWQRSFGENQLCGCGVPFHECDFWREITKTAFGFSPACLDVEKALGLKSSLEQKSHIPSLVLNRPNGYESALRAYGELLERLCSAILDVSNARVIVDSSKDPRHGLVLSGLDRFEVHVVHLVRDPRAVAFSWTRIRRRPEIHWTSRDMLVKGPWATATRWTTHNAVAELLSRAAASHIRVRYEDLVSEPDATLSRILASCGCSQQKVNGATGSSVLLEPSHTVSGNPMRFARGSLSIELDDEWCTGLPLRSRLAVDTATWPLLRRYGYSLSRRGATSTPHPPAPILTGLSEGGSL